MALYFTLTSFLAALLLFSIQPMVARLLLPALGGSPAVWNTAMVFFQAMLLGGYFYAHGLGAGLTKRRRPVLLLHGLVVLLPLALLPIRLPPHLTPPVSSHPVFWLLGLLAILTGAPFFVVSTSSPLLQRLFALTGHRDAADPYFLYAASNAGSFIALLAYPLFIEPNLGLGMQTRLWFVGYCGLIVALWGCLLLVWRAPQVEAPAAAEFQSRAASVSWRRRLRWVGLALVPSSLMLSVTTYLSTDVMAIPMLWVVPLSLYLLSFVVVFARRPSVPPSFWPRLLVILLLPLVVALGGRASSPMWLLMPLHLASFFVASVVCHGEMARDRPPVSRLTEFYGWMALGGVLGGIFNALIAPSVFTDVYEYFLTLIALGFLLPRDLLADVGAKLAPASWRDAAWAAGIALATLFCIEVARQLGADNRRVTDALCLGLPALLCFPLSRQPFRFGLALAAFLGCAVLYGPDARGQILDAQRSFFGIHHVVLSADGRFNLLLHGSTYHGAQRRSGDRRDPVSYYSRQGPAGDLMRAAQARRGTRPLRVAAVGLGAGALAAYIRPGDDWTYYEIDPVVAAIARDPRFFTYWSGAPTPPKLVLGDARLALKAAPDAGYDLIILDAYSSDNIPVHLVTREAFALYSQKLAPGGMIGWHISNRWFDLEPVIGRLAKNAHWASLMRRNGAVSPQQTRDFILPSDWVAVAPRRDSLGQLGADSHWQPLRTNGPLWTDDQSSLWTIWQHNGLAGK